MFTPTQMIVQISANYVGQNEVIHQLMSFVQDYEGFEPARELLYLWSNVSDGGLDNPDNVSIQSDESEVSAVQQVSRNFTQILYDVVTRISNQITESYDRLKQRSYTATGVGVGSVTTVCVGVDATVSTESREVTCTPVVQGQEVQVSPVVEAAEVQVTPDSRSVEIQHCPDQLDVSVGSNEPHTNVMGTQIESADKAEFGTDVGVGSTLADEIAFAFHVQDNFSGVEQLSSMVMTLTQRLGLPVPVSGGPNPNFIYDPSMISLLQPATYLVEYIMEQEPPVIISDPAEGSSLVEEYDGHVPVIAASSLQYEIVRPRLDRYRQDIRLASPKWNRDGLTLSYRIGTKYFLLWRQNEKMYTALNASTAGVVLSGGDGGKQLNPFLYLPFMCVENQKFVLTKFNYEQKANRSVFEDGIMGLVSAQNILKARMHFYFYKNEITRGNVACLQLVSARNRQRYVCRNGGRFNSVRCSDPECPGCLEFGGILDFHAEQRCVFIYRVI